MKFDFVKMTALGNDFIMVDGLVYDVEAVSAAAMKLCDRRFGIGADGVIFILDGTEESDFSMRIINSDGSEPEMCGNGIRCFAKWLEDRNEFTQDSLKVNTLAGVRIITKEEVGYRVDMGNPILEPSQIPTTAPDPLSVPLDSVGFIGTAVGIGNPHVVLFTSEITDEQVFVQGPAIEKDTVFPNNTNVEFIKVISATEIEMRVWERGCGETLACGTGACAAMVAGVLNSHLSESVTVHLLGGDLLIEWDGKETSPVFMTGDAQELFTGVYTV